MINTFLMLLKSKALTFHTHVERVLAQLVQGK
jgi:hypothetical protein